MAGDVDTTFAEQVARMRRISDRTEPYGEGTPYEQATRYYLEHLVDACADRARRASPDLPRSVDLLISLTGFSPRITVLACKILRPSRLVVMPSDNARGSIDVIDEHLVKRGPLKPSEFVWRPCAPTDPMSIYRNVRDVLDEVKRSQQSHRIIAYIDITGGRKVMSAAAALAAWQLDLGLCYVDGAFDEELKQAVPGSDRLLLLDNPTTLFGEQEMTAAEHAFDGGAFDAAHNRFEELAGRLAQPGRARFMAALSALYKAWCDLDVPALRPAVEDVHQKLGPVLRELSGTTVQTVQAQIAFLTKFSEGNRRALLLTFSLLDSHYRNVGRRDFAALLSYRTIELCLSAWMEEQYRGFDCKAPDWGLLAIDQAQLKQEYRRVLDARDECTSKRSLPSTVGPAAAAALLHVLRAPLTAAAGLDSVEGLRKLGELTRARNDSILAHGETPVSLEISEQLHEKAAQILQAYWRLRYPNEKLSQLQDELAFVRVGRS